MNYFKSSELFRVTDDRHSSKAKNNTVSAPSSRPELVTTLAANGLLDALAFAATPSIAGVTEGVVGAYLNDLDSGNIDWQSTEDLKSVIMEIVRGNPPVLGVPFEYQGTRYHSVVGYTGYDFATWGDDAHSFRKRGDAEFYRSRTLNWADAALPLPGKLESARICPARSLSFNLMLVFLQAKVPRVGAGPGFWPAFPVTRI